MGNMMGGTCANTESGAAGADKICKDRASNAELPSGFSYTHRAMLHRGGTGDSAHPRNLDIPNKEREIRRVDNTTVIAEHYDMSGAGNDYWDLGYTLQNPPSERIDSTDSTKSIHFSWSGIDASASPSDNCNDWEDGSDSTVSYIGGVVSAVDRERFTSDGSPYVCNVFQYPPSSDIGLLCASY